LGFGTVKVVTLLAHIQCMLRELFHYQSKELSWDSPLL